MILYFPDVKFRYRVCIVNAKVAGDESISFVVNRKFIAVCTATVCGAVGTRIDQNFVSDPTLLFVVLYKALNSLLFPFDLLWGNAK